MPTRTLGVALWNYRDDDGRRRRALYGQQFDLPEDEIARGERAGVFAPEPEPVPERGSVSVDTPSGLPRLTALKPAWVDYAETIGIDRAEAEAMTKPELIAAVQTHLRPPPEKIEGGGPS